MLVRTDTAFRPEAVERLNAVFQQAWEFVRRSGDADPTAEEHFRDINSLATSYVENIARMEKAMSGDWPREQSTGSASRERSSRTGAGFDRWVGYMNTPFLKREWQSYRRGRDVRSWHQNGPADRALIGGLFIGGVQTRRGHAATSEIDPERTPIRQYPFASLLKNLSTHTFFRNASDIFDLRRAFERHTTTRGSQVSY